MRHLLIISVAAFLAGFSWNCHDSSTTTKEASRPDPKLTPPIAQCGNGRCEWWSGESCLTCRRDCTKCCGDRTCSSSAHLKNPETCASCPTDCGDCCGNHRIDGGETCDPPDSCITRTTCRSRETDCLIARYTGSHNTCNASCTLHMKPCANSVRGVDPDNCCPPGCTEDPDCGLPEHDTPPSPCTENCRDERLCGDETCEFSSGTNEPYYHHLAVCSSNVCIESSALSCEECAALCTYEWKVCKAASDGCCPLGCLPHNDSDCTGTNEGQYYNEDTKKWEPAADQPRTDGNGT